MLLDNMINLISEFHKKLEPVCGLSEARAIARLVLETRFHIRQVDIYAGKDIKFSDSDVAEWYSILARLLKGEPVQYVLGEADFCNHTFSVTPDVLIPRPETEQLVDWAKDVAATIDKPCILDIGTGSGCIAVSLAAECRGAKVTGWDVSEAALDVARGNALRNGVEVEFERRDALSLDSYSGKYDIVVSNPPYIGQSESSQMERNVLDYEPRLALFVPDDDLLVFYKAIAEGALALLSNGGSLMFEINQACGEAVMQMMKDKGYHDVELRQDYIGRDRMVRGLR